jgi:Fe2+-dicitrate sensor, membrane component
MSKKKKTISGFSADYRGAYEKPTENETVDPVADEEDADDFLPEYGESPDEELLTKWSEEPEPESEEEPELPAPKKSARRRGRRRYGVAVGSLVLLLALTGVVFIVGAIGKQVYTAATDDSKLREYDTFLTPVVMQDPQPFASPDKAPDDFVLNASLWKTIMANNGTNYTEYDDAGKVLVPLGDVVQACRDLFGPNCQLQPKTPAQETFFTYNSDENKFHVALYSSDSTFIPYTDSAKKQGDSTVLRVGYVSPSDTWRTQTSSAVSSPKPTKYMDYVLKTDPSTNKEYIYAVQAAS